jgi:hypothetical protein
MAKNSVSESDDRRKIPDDAVHNQTSVEFWHQHSGTKPWNHRRRAGDADYRRGGLGDVLRRAGCVFQDFVTLWLDPAAFAPGKDADTGRKRQGARRLAGR